MLPRYERNRFSLRTLRLCESHSNSGADLMYFLAEAQGARRVFVVNTQNTLRALRLCESKKNLLYALRTRATARTGKALNPMCFMLCSVSLSTISGDRMPRCLALTGLVLFAFSGSALAQDFEITPFIGWRTSSSLEEVNTGETINVNETDSFGFILSMKQSKDTTYDFLFSRQNTELQPSTSPSNTESIRIDYYQIGGTVVYHVDKLHPYVTGGLGATHISPANDDLSTETKFSLSVGGGLKVPLGQRVGLRLEARGYGTVVSSGGTILCSGGCVAQFKGSLYMQFEASAGLSIAF